MVSGFLFANPVDMTKRTRSVLNFGYSGLGYPLGIYDNYRGIGYYGPYAGYSGYLDDNEIGYYADLYSYDY